MFSVHIQYADHASDALAGLKGALSEHEIAEAVAEAEMELFRTHLLANGTNKRHWPSTAFWARAAKSIGWSEELGGVSINIAQVGVRQRAEGGAIYPTGDHVHLSIPARPEAYGHVPADFTNLRLAFRHVDGRAQAFALVEADASQTKSNSRASSHRLSPGKDTVGGGVYFWLVDSVYQDPDPGVIPNDQEIAATARHALETLAEKFSHR
jgi:hypothetical protein